ncbi:MAG: M12 family metallo-peptidase, partial [Candidatus Aminicenantaceae bacterium]
MRLFKVLIFSALFFLPFKTVIPHVQPVRTVTLKVVVDEEYRKKDDWSMEVSRIVAGASKVFEKNFGIRFEIKNMGFWNSRNSQTSMMVLLNDLQGSVPHMERDVVL